MLSLGPLLSLGLHLNDGRVCSLNTDRHLAIQRGLSITTNPTLRDDCG